MKVKRSGQRGSAFLGAAGMRCPDCGGGIFIRSSHQPTPKMGIVYAICGDLECGWRGRLSIEVTGEAHGGPVGHGNQYEMTRVRDADRK